MARGRENAADSLGDVIESIRARRQTGSLSVERMQGGRFEEGEIIFQNGQPVKVNSGQMSGQEALVWLLSWRPVYFSFSADAPRLPANDSPAPATRGDALPVPAPASSAPASARRSATSASPVLNANRTSPPNTVPVTPRISTITPPGGLNDGAPPPPAILQQSQANTTAATPGLEWLAPQKLGSDRDVLSLPLTRPQRSIYLLIDGRRSVNDLARCMRKSTQEIERLLSELQEHGLITL